MHLDSGYQLAALFYSLSAMPPDYDVLAGAASEEYRAATDQFRKRDLLEALRGKIDQDLARYKDPQNRYFTVDQATVPIQHFPVNAAVNLAINRSVTSRGSAMRG